MAELIRLSKLMAQKGMCSRREADELIKKGLVFVNGERISELGTKVLEDVSVELSGVAKKTLEKKVTILLNKPVGYVSGQAEKEYKAAISLIQAENHDGAFSGRKFSSRHKDGLAPAGRLDIDSTGLLVLTQDGVVARQLVGQDSPIEKEYLVRVQGHVTDKKLELLCHGLQLDGRKLKPAEVTRLNQDQLKFILREGRKRQIRRMCEAVDLEVTGLKRVRIGKVKLGRLKQGQWRYLHPSESF